MPEPLLLTHAKSFPRYAHTRAPLTIVIDQVSAIPTKLNPAHAYLMLWAVQSSRERGTLLLNLGAQAPPSPSC